jgi:hypothetical protein
MNIPENFIFVSSLNTRLYNHRDNFYPKNVPSAFPNNRCILYHENSFDSANYNELINLDEMKHLTNLELIDLFEETPWLESFLRESPFKDCYKSTNYYIKNSPFWFRKVVSIASAVSKLKEGDVMVWADCDSFIKKELPAEFLEYQKKYDWTTIFRKNDWIESGFQFININERTKEFAKYYLDYYLSGDVFVKDPEWADGWTLNTCFELFKNKMTIGGLTPDFNCPIHIMDYIHHSKNPLQEVRAKYKI